MDNDVNVKLKIAAYEKGILPEKMSQLENDVPYATVEFVNKVIHERTGKIDGGDIAYLLNK